MFPNKPKGTRAFPLFETLWPGLRQVGLKAQFDSEFKNNFDAGKFIEHVDYTAKETGGEVTEILAGFPPILQSIYGGRKICALTMDPKA